jgi:hypothetical protein
MRITELLIRANAFRDRTTWNRAVRIISQKWPSVVRFKDEHLTELIEELS